MVSSADAGPRTIFYLMTIGHTAQLALFAGGWPERVASHFNSKGGADAYMERELFVLTWLCVSGGFFLAITALSWLVGKFPRITNIPDQHYWLAAERRDESLSYVRRILFWVGSLTIGLFMAILQVVHIANQAEIPRIGSEMYFMLTAYAVGMLLLIIKFLRRFS